MRMFQSKKDPNWMIEVRSLYSSAMMRILKVIGCLTQIVESLSLVEMLSSMKENHRIGVRRRKDHMIFYLISKMMNQLFKKLKPHHQLYQLYHLRCHHQQLHLHQAQVKGQENTEALQTFTMKLRGLMIQTYYVFLLTLSL